MRLLLVGDPHVTVDDLDDAQKLIGGIVEVCQEENPDAVVILGDLHHNHALVRVEVMDFWRKAFLQLAPALRLGNNVFLLVGNHDRPNDLSTPAHALSGYSDALVKVIDKPQTIGQDIWLLPYMSNEAFVEAVLKLPKPKMLICHQTFDGSTYDNGFYAPDGIDPALVGVPVIVSGHIHTAQIVNWSGGYIDYIGSPRWRIASDANVEKNIVIWDTDAQTCKAFATAKWCSPMGHAQIPAGVDVRSVKVPFSDNPRARISIEATGPKASLEALVASIKDVYPRARVRPVPTDRAATVAGVVESQGIGKALDRYMRAYVPKHGTDPGVLREMVTKHLGAEIL